ncbi:MAG: hypothetical protein V5B31_11020 [Candidatus Accumulibacter propinquus]
MVTLRRALDRFAFQRQDHRLRIEQLIEAAAQNRPVFLLDRKMAAEVQHRDLTDLATMRSVRTSR